MQDVYRKLALRTREISDLLVMAACFLLAAYGSYRDVCPVSFSNCLSVRIKVVNLVTFAFFLLVWHCLFVAFGLYRTLFLSSARRAIVDIFKATFAGSATLLALGALFKIVLITPKFIALLWLGSSAAIAISRLAFGLALKALRHKRGDLRQLLIVGTNQRAVNYAKEIESKPELGYRIAGFVENGWLGNHQFRQSGYPVVTDFEKFPEFIRTHVVDEVMICLPMRSYYEKSLQIAKSCEKQGINVCFLSDFFDLALAKSSAEMVNDKSMITLHTGAMQGGPLLAKRGIDVLLSVALLLFLSPLFAIIALAVKLTSPGPIFFSQERVGLNKRKFRVHKFRTMVPDAEKDMHRLEQLNEVSGPVFKIKNDPRITWIGKYLRKSSLDELPQIINVLNGDMSLVGPRPLPVRDYEGFDEDWQRRRFSVRPGITCLWQVKGRSGISFDRWMELDIEYIDNWSLVLDANILLKTIPAVLKGSGAS